MLPVSHNLLKKGRRWYFCGELFLPRYLYLSPSPFWFFLTEISFVWLCCPLKSPLFFSHGGGGGEWSKKKQEQTMFNDLRLDMVFIWFNWVSHRPKKLKVAKVFLKTWLVTPNHNTKLFDNWFYIDFKFFKNAKLAKNLLKLPGHSWSQLVTPGHKTKYSEKLFYIVVGQKSQKIAKVFLKIYLVTPGHTVTTQNCL